MRTILPKTLSVNGLVESGERLRGEVELSEMPRVAELVVRREHDEATGPVSVELAANRVNDGIRLHGALHGEVRLECQRCLEPVGLALNAEIDVLVVGSDEAEARISTDIDTVVAEDGQLEVATFFEDEVLLSLPVTPVHADGECSAPEFAGLAERGASSEPGLDAQGRLVRKPFADLAERLKQV